ncbi:unnamed protein product [Discosporangium mesarthrocarpum]
MGSEGTAGQAHSNGGAAAEVPEPCPLAQIPVLLLTAAQDFHLAEDAESLVSMLEAARHRSWTLEKRMTAATTATRVAPVVRPRPWGVDGQREGGGGEGKREEGEEGVPKEEDGAEPDPSRSMMGGCGDRDGGGVEAAVVAEGDRAWARHILLEGEDHMSVILHFGEPGDKASELVLKFLRGLPRPPPKRREGRGWQRPGG